MNKHAFVRREGVRSSALLSAAALATTGLIAAAAPAGAALSQGGNDATTGAPAYFADSQGVAVQLCLEACAEVDEETGQPGPAPEANHAAYFGAEAALANGLTAMFEVATIPGEDAQGNETSEVGGVENSVRIDADRGTLVAGARYVAQTPWGRLTFNAEDNGAANFRIASGGEAGSARNGHVQTFLRPAAGIPDGILGDGHAFVQVTGSPTGFNRFHLSGPGVNAGTNRFALMGQLRDDTAMSSVNAKSLKLGSITKATPSRGTVNVSSFGTADLSLNATLAGANPGAFAVSRNGCAAAAPGSACNITVSYTPRANRNVSAILTLNDPADLTPARQVTLMGIANDTRSPKVVSSTPAKGAGNVAPGKTLKVGFSEDISGAKSGLMLVDRSGDKVAARVSRVRRTSTYKLNPRQALDRNASYTVKVNGGRNGIQDLAGNAARDVQWGFRTR